jgi:hypothetical protein
MKSSMFSVRLQRCQRLIIVVIQMHATIHLSHSAPNTMSDLDSENTTTDYGKAKNLCKFCRSSCLLSEGAFGNDELFELSSQTSENRVQKLAGTWVESGPSLPPKQWMQVPPKVEWASGTAESGALRPFWGWVQGGVALWPREYGRCNPRKIFEFLPAKPCILVHFWMMLIYM